MKAFVCEMCGSNDLVKQDGVFVCQYCGTKYSVEEAKKLMVEGTVRIDRSRELENLYQAARNARQAGDYQSAIRHYENISAEDPNGWEARFYCVALKSKSLKNGEIKTVAIYINNNLDTVFSLIKNHVSGEEEKKAAVKEIVMECCRITKWLTECSFNFYKTSTKGNGLMMLTGISGAAIGANSSINALKAESDRQSNIVNIMSTCGKSIEINFGLHDKEYALQIMISYKQIIELNSILSSAHKMNSYFAKNFMSEVYAKVKFMENKINEFEQAEKTKLAEEQKYKAEQEEKEKKERLKRYWDEHAVEKQSLENKLSELRKEEETIANQIRQIYSEEISPIKAEKTNLFQPQNNSKQLKKKLMCLKLNLQV